MIATSREDFMASIQVTLTEFEYVPLIKVVVIKFPLYDEAPRKDSIPTFIQAVLRKRVCSFN